MKKIIGVDLGSSSIGWAIREDNKIVNEGVVTFKTGMIKGKGGYSSPTKDRREARSKRRLIQVRKYRKWELLKLLVENEMVPLKTDELEIWTKYKKGTDKKFPESELFLKWLSCDFTYQNGVMYKNPYEIRVKGLDEKLLKHEFGRALYHIIQRRGYKDIGEKDKETENQIERRKEDGFDIAMHKNRTIGEALKIGFLDKGKRARNEYPYRDEYEHELVLLCERQGFDISKNKKGDYNDSFVQSIWKSIIWQRPLQSQKGKIGKCTLEPKNNRIPISHPLFEFFRAMQYINTIKTVSADGKKTTVPLDFRKDLLNDKFLKNAGNFKFDAIQKYLDKKFQQKKEYNYLNKENGKYDSMVSGMPVCKKFIDLFGEKVIEHLLNLHYYTETNKIPKVINGYSIDDIWHIIFDCNDINYLKKFGMEKLGINHIYKEINGETITENKFADIKKSFVQGYSDLSAKAIKKILPFLLNGYVYNEAVLLAKMPDLLGEKWEAEREAVLSAIKESVVRYEYKSDIGNITNGLINKYKGLEYDYEKSYKLKDKYLSINYQLDTNDKEDVEIACKKYFGEKSFTQKEDKENIIQEVASEYQLFFYEKERAYRTKLTLTEILGEILNENDIVIDVNNLYHHSDKKNLYPKPIYNEKIDKNILAVPQIDSIKNPMFNKAMSILRKLMNELIIANKIDENTDVVVEVARELNDNNKRIAIERYQKEKRDNREKYREFIREFSNQNNLSLNVNDKINDFELWTEQIFDEENEKIDDKMSNRVSIQKEKSEIDRYELWMEQKGQCIYTGKMISISQLFSDKIEIEHTIPRSLLPDNTKANQTVCFSKYNRNIKNNRTPIECPNYNREKNGFSEILPRLEYWKKIKNRYQKDYDNNKKPKGAEEENAKNIRIQKKHYYKIHLDYWRDKLERFTTDEIKESWARRQLVDTQMVSKYAKEFLKTYFKKVNVEKGIITAEFRKIYGFQNRDEEKSRNKHTHHAIDATVLTLIPNNASRKKVLLEKAFFFEEERKGKQFKVKPYPNFNAQDLINNIENDTLIFNYTKDKIISQTFKKVRKRNVVQKDKNDKTLWMKGDSIRGDLYGQTFLSKIKDVELDQVGRPVRDSDGNWKFKKDKDEYIYATKKPIDEVKSKYIKDIIDPNIRELVELQKNNDEIFDYQGNKIRRVRVKVRKGRVVKERRNYKSKSEHKNFYYASAGEIPYAILLEKVNEKNIERKMIPIAIHEVAKVFKEFRKFNSCLYLDFFHNGLKEKYANWKLLSVGQRVLVLNNDDEYEKVNDYKFQSNRLYYITRFFIDGGGGMYLKHHLEATKDEDLDMLVKEQKNILINKYDEEFNLPKIKENMNISDIQVRKKDFKDRKYKFVGIKDYRFSRLIPSLGEEKVKQLIKETKQFQKQASYISIEGKTPLLKICSRNCNFLYDGEDFEMSILGEFKTYSNS